MTATVLTFGEHRAEKLNIAAWACTRRGDAFPTIRYSREDAHSLLVRWAALDRQDRPTAPGPSPTDP